MIFYLQQTSNPGVVTIAPDQADAKRHFFNINRRELPTCPQLRVIRVDGALFFGAVANLEDQLDNLLNGDESNLLIVGTGISLIDLAGAELLEKQAKKWQSKGGKLYFSSLRKQVRHFLQQGGYWESMGAENFFETKEEAINYIFKQLDNARCAECDKRIFIECKSLEEIKIEEV